MTAETQLPSEMQAQGKMPQEQQLERPAERSHHLRSASTSEVCVIICELIN